MFVQRNLMMEVAIGRIGLIIDVINVINFSIRNVLISIILSHQVIMRDLKLMTLNHLDPQIVEVVKRRKGRNKVIYN
jgi:hypothetical protein